MFPTFAQRLVSKEIHQNLLLEPAAEALIGTFRCWCADPHSRRQICRGGLLFFTHGRAATSSARVTYCAKC
jgi:hypothetical protein